MESDLSLIEISGEDDSLLQQIPNDDVSTLKTNQRSSYSDYFSCSPLQIPRSKPTAEGNIVNGDLEKTCSSCIDSINVENSNSSKAEAPKLSAERQQMKRKKKGGGYNLRKSLAWNRAFFTEEGVLNSAELSMISRDCSKSSGDMLSVIEEEGHNCSNDSSDLQALEENLFMELPAISSSKERSTVDGLLPNLDWSPVVRRKVLSAHDVNRSGSKRSGCPRPVASSSLKRPANSNTTKEATKDPQVSKLPVLKPDPGAASRIPKSALSGGSGSKRNQMAQTAINIQKNTRLKASPNNFLNNAKPVPAGRSLTTKTSLGQGRRNEASSVKRVSTNLKLSPEVTSNPILPSAGYASKADDGSSNRPLPSARYAPKADDGSRKIVIPLPQNACYTGVSMQHVQPQIAKPSGLRMPSPSLGFFGQAKSPSLHNPLNRNSQPCNLPKYAVSNLGNLHANHIHELRPPLVPRKIPKVVNGGATAVNMVSCSNSGSSAPSTVNPALLENIELVSQGTDMAKVEKKVQHDHDSYEGIKNENILHRVVDMDQQLMELAEPCFSETISQIEGIELQRSDKNCEVGLSNKNQMLQTSKEDLFNKSQGPEELQNFNCAKVLGICLKVQDSSAAGIENSNASSHPQFTEKEKDDNKAVHEVRTKSHADDAGGQSLDGNITVASSNSNLRTSMDNQDKLVVADVNGKYKHLESFSTSIIGKKSNSAEIENSDASSHLQFTEKEKDDNRAVHEVRTKSRADDAGGQSLDGNITVASSNSNLRTSMDNQHKLVVADVNEKYNNLASLSTSVTGEQGSTDDASNLDDCLTSANNLHLEESTDKNVTHCVESAELDGIDTSKTESKHLGAPCLVPLAMLDHGSILDKLECHNLDENVSESAIEQCDGRGNDSIQVASVVQDGCLDVNKEAESLEMEITVTDYIAIEPSVETVQCYAQPHHRHENELSSQATSLEFDLSSIVNNNQISRDPLTFNSMSFSSMDEELGSSVIGDETSSSERILGDNNVSVLRDKSLPNEAENILSLNSHRLNGELQPKLGNAIPTDDKNAGMKRKSGNDKKQDTLLIKPPSNAVPFSEEWLAAFEIAGEEILTMKSGAVQHSPPDKSQPEPGPWSPVKRKNTQVIGPFDCTKHSIISNIPPPSPH